MALAAADLTSASLAASFIPLSKMLAASAAATLRLSGSEAASSILLYRSFHCSSSSYLAAASAAVFSSSVEAISSTTLTSCQFLWIWINLKCEHKIWSFNVFFRLQSEMIFFRLPVWNVFPDYQNEMNLKLFEAIWNLKTQSKILCNIMKPVWNYS